MGVALLLRPGGAEPGTDRMLANPGGGGREGGKRVIATEASSYKHIIDQCARLLVSVCEEDWWWEKQLEL